MAGSEFPVTPSGDVWVRGQVQLFSEKDQIRVKIALGRRKCPLDQG